MLRSLLIAAIMACLADSAMALEIAGWHVETAPNSANECTVSRHYADKDDGGAPNAIAFVFGKEEGKLGVAIGLGYREWDWDDGDTKTADLLVDDEVERRALEWDAGSSKHALTYFTTDWQAFTQTIAEGKSLTLRFDGDKDDEASFATKDIGQALGAAQVCTSQIK